MNQVLTNVQEHFNEPILVNFRLSRLVGYTEDNDEPYYLIRDVGGSITSHTGYVNPIFLDVLKGQNKKISNDGIVWDDYKRVDVLLASHNCPQIEMPIYNIPNDSKTLRLGG